MSERYIVRSIEETPESILEYLLIEDISFDSKDDAQAFINTYSQDIVKLSKIVTVEVKEVQ